MATLLNTPQVFPISYDWITLDALSRAQNGGDARIGVVEDPSGQGTLWGSSYPIDLTNYDTELVAIKGPVLVAAATAACQTISDQIIPDATHRDAYQNAATIVWASGGKAPTADPAKSIFAAQGASVGITVPDTFAEVVTAVSLASMQLVTILGTVRGAVDKATAQADLAAALSAFEASVANFVTGLNASGLTVSIVAPDPIVIAGING